MHFHLRGALLTPTETTTPSGNEEEKTRRGKGYWEPHFPSYSSNSFDTPPTREEGEAYEEALIPPLILGGTTIPILGTFTQPHNR